MTKLADKRVAIIGTGATAVQCVPHLARDCGELFVFQRTPSSIDVRNNHPIDPEWFATLEPGWQREWMMNFTTLQTGGFADEDLVKDGWTDISQRIRDRVLADAGDFSPAAMEKAYHDSDDEKMEEIRARVDEIIDDSGDGRGPEALVPAALQAPVLPRRVPRRLQPAQRPPRRHRRQGRRGDHAAGRGGGRQRVRGRLHHLRERFRGRHRMDAAHRLRRHRSRAGGSCRSTGPTGCAASTDSRCTGSRTRSSSALRRAPT